MRARASSFSDEATCYVYYMLPNIFATQRSQPIIDTNKPDTKKETATINKTKVIGSCEVGFSLIENKKKPPIKVIAESINRTGRFHFF